MIGNSYVQVRGLNGPNAYTIKILRDIINPHEKTRELFSVKGRNRMGKTTDKIYEIELGIAGTNMREIAYCKHDFFQTQTVNNMFKQLA